MLPDLAREQADHIIARFQAGRPDLDDSSELERCKQELIGRLAEITGRFAGTALQAHMSMSAEDFNWQLYDALRLVRQTFDELVEALSVQQPPGVSPITVSTLYRPAMPNEEIRLDGQGRVEIHEPSWMNVEFYRRFRDALDGIDATRIRRCKQCGKLFWAKRQDQSTCSRTCAGRRRFSKFYENRTNRARHRARQLKTQGYSDAAIAKRLEVDIPTIREWTKSRKEKRR